MAKPEWGRKRTCQVCGKKYYDLNKSPIICPCPEAVEFDPNDYLSSKKSKIIPLKASVDDNNDLTKDIENIDNIDDIDDIEIDTDEEVVSDDDPLLEINKEDDEIDMDEDVSFIDDDEITEDDNGINVEINEDDKN